METELKLRVDPLDLDRLNDHPLFAEYCRQAPQQTEQQATYYDTPDLRLRQAGAHLRVRQSHELWRQTFKADVGTLAGLHRRKEWETSLEGSEPDIEQLRRQIGDREKCHHLLQDLEQYPTLQPLFGTKVTRTTWTLHLPGGEEVEAALDQGTLTCAELSLPLCELELELQSGQPACLFNLALELMQSLPLRLESRSKPDRGYALLAQRSADAVKATPLKLGPDISVEQAFRVIVGNCLTQVQGNERGVAESPAPDSLHQMRVGLRRLFESLIACPMALQTQVQELTSQLGAGRDWDVLLGSTLPRIDAALEASNSWIPLRRALAEQAGLAHRAAATAVQAPGYSELLLRFGGWLENRTWRDERQTDLQQLDLALAVFADKCLKQANKRLLQRAKGLKHADAEQLHRLRIAAKRLRYACEFFQALYPRKKLQPYLQALTGLQDELGKLNDAHVGSPGTELEFAL